MKTMNALKLSLASASLFLGAGNFCRAQAPAPCGDGNLHVELQARTQMVSMVARFTIGG